MTLSFQSPTTLNNAKEAFDADKHTWFHASHKGNDNGILELDSDTWNISCPENKISEPINHWMVDEENYTMKLQDEKIEGNFKALDYAFAVSMIGQLLPANKLIAYLTDLQEIFRVTPDNSNK